MVDMDNKYTWATEDIYKSNEEWEKEYEKVKAEINFSEYKGKLKDKKEFLSLMKKQESVGRRVDKLAVYACMNHDKDTRVSLYDSMVNKITSLSVKFNEETAFVLPELTSLSEKVLKGYIEDKELKDYDYFLKGILKDKKHVLSTKEETLLAMSGEALSSFHDIFGKIDDADLPLTFVKDKDGKKTELSHGVYGLIMHGEDRNLRKQAFKRYYGAYISLIDVISSTYYGNVKKDVFYAKARKYKSSLSSALSGEDVSEKVYKNLISSVKKGLPSLHKYMSEKKKELGYKTMHMYDVYVPTVKEQDLKLSYEDAYALVVKGLSVLGEDYQKLLLKAKDERWIDVYESKGKRSGAYSTAVYDTHPYVLLNYQQTTNEIFTIAHEMGHSIHSYFSNNNQPYMKADYKIFVAEVASTVNEVLLVKYLLKTATDKKLKKYLLSYLLEMMRTTLFRQTQFAEFEEFSHSLVENGLPLTKDNMSEKYMELNKKYYGRSVYHDTEIQYEWARIPHFYRAFYVYKYATGITSALTIADRILREGEPAVKDYFKFLSSGNSDSPVELLKIAGVDLTSKQPFEKAMQTFKDTLNEYVSIQVR